MGEESTHSALPVDFEQLLRQALNTQQPFYVSILNQISSLEARQERQWNEITAVRDMAQLLVNQELLKKNQSLEERLQILEDERQQWTGVKNATIWMPKVIQWLVILIAVVVFYLKFDIRVPPS